MLVGGDSTTTAHADPSRQRVGATAFGVAAFRAMESQSNDRPTGPLIHDAAAEAIFALVSGTAPLRWRLMVWASKVPLLKLTIPLLSRRAGRLRTMVALRTRHIDAAIDTARRATATPLQLVIVGSGLDTRCLRLKLRDAHDAVGFSRIFELDFEGMHEEKRRQLALSASLATPPHVASIGVDLSVPGAWQEVSEKLTSEGFLRSRPSVWVLEGLTSYLTPTELKSTLQSIADLSAPESRLIATFLSATRPPGCIGEACKLGMHKFTTDDPIPEVAVFGPATLVTIGELAAFSPEAARLGVSASDASYTIVTATKR